MDRRKFFGRFGKLLAAAAIASHMKLGELVPVPGIVDEPNEWVSLGRVVQFTATVKSEGSDTWRKITWQQTLPPKKEKEQPVVVNIPEVALGAKGFGYVYMLRGEEVKK